ncbi:hypothetical protein E4T43_09181 [Aureobasidium subglaciale]|nr:hypothetical protein E4T43_09181 [Aureobasidium subglaciale]
MYGRADGMPSFQLTVAPTASAIHGDRSLKTPCFCIHCELYPEILYESVSCWSNDCAFSQLSVSRIRRITRTRVPPERLVIDK